MNIRHEKISRVRGLDTLRFLLASWVVFGHFGFLGLDFPKTTFTTLLARGFLANLFNGPAAVIVFFLISGFCIHFPFRHGERIAPLPYYSRRYVRILVPMAVAIGLGKIAKTPLTLFNDSVLWSLLCEEVYYAIYPALILFKGRVGWKALFVIASIGSLAVIASDPLAGNYASYGFALNWILGLPVWLMGCWLAENFEGRRVTTHTLSAIWLWRGGIWFLSSFLSVLRFHTPLRYPWTLNIFAIFALAWLEREIAFFTAHQPPEAAEWAGKWSYSLYLLHVPLAALFVSWLGAPTRGPFQWGAQIALVYIGSYAFYLSVEKPSHHLARRLGLRIAALHQSAFRGSGAS